jgi:nucleoside-diphosphate-sugar epimerase
MKRVLVFGGAGQIGYATALELLTYGCAVDVVTRGGRPLAPSLVTAGATHIEGDGLTRCDLIHRQNQDYDAVVDPNAFTAEDATDLLSASDRFGTAIVVSTGSVYTDEAGRSLDTAAQTGFPQFSGPLSETTPRLSPGPQSYSFQKVAMEDICFASDVPVSLLRPWAVHGTLARHPREWWVVKRLLYGRVQVPLAFGGRSIFHASSTRGIASLTRLCIETPGNHVVNVADPDVLTVSQIAAALADHLDRPLTIVPFEGAAAPPAKVGHTPWSAEHPLILDTSAARAFGWDGGPSYKDALTPYVTWMQDIAASGVWEKQFTAFAGYAHDPFDYKAEDAFLAKHME